MRTPPFGRWVPVPSSVLEGTRDPLDQVVARLRLADLGAAPFPGRRVSVRRTVGSSQIWIELRHWPLGAAEMRFLRASLDSKLMVVPEFAVFPMLAHLFAPIARRLRNDAWRALTGSAQPNLVISTSKRSVRPLNLT